MSEPVLAVLRKDLENIPATDVGVRIRSYIRGLIGMIEAGGHLEKHRQSEQAEVVKDFIFELRERDGLCVLCGEPTDSLAGNPARWCTPLPTAAEPGVMKPHHMGCVLDAMRRGQESQGRFCTDGIEPPDVVSFTGATSTAPVQNDQPPGGAGHSQGPQASDSSDGGEKLEPGSAVAAEPRRGRISDGPSGLGQQPKPSEWNYEITERLRREFPGAAERIEQMRAELERAYEMTDEHGMGGGRTLLEAIESMWSVIAKCHREHRGMASTDKPSDEYECHACRAPEKGFGHSFGPRCSAIRPAQTHQAGGGCSHPVASFLEGFEGQCPRCGERLSSKSKGER